MNSTSRVLLGRRTAAEKVAAFLLKSSNAKCPDRRVLGHSAMPMSRQDIAYYLGLAIETVSRTLTKLAREKVIVIVPDGVRLLGKERLGRIAAA